MAFMFVLWFWVDSKKNDYMNWREKNLGAWHGGIGVQAYENAKLYKENTKPWHDVDKRIQKKCLIFFIQLLKLFPENMTIFYQVFPQL